MVLGFGLVLTGPRVIERERLAVDVVYRTPRRVNNKRSRGEGLHDPVGQEAADRPAQGLGAPGQRPL